jgi:hypothetical protein
MKTRFAAAALLLCAAAPAAAAESITYRYDARGRLVRVERAGPVNQVVGHGHDKAGNRTSKTVQ